MEGLSKKPLRRYEKKCICIYVCICVDLLCWQCFNNREIRICGGLWLKERKSYKFNKVVEN